ncbi:hypothetical protein MUN81_13190 [Hymenobacter sp. 5317J-9]|uniref:hypothetical protein n=1 Tax=Hymenobacter sp. 5317J-9 TaxID=2932250 RepID=UPI001FD6C85D|nr:hypothetical protein [Hymenobacter sp. 5317J-9]UOQ96207.1 hypothetical protein MUN81_13190 [Hymenobacter sp. 5317J-9]
MNRLLPLTSVLLGLVACQSTPDTPNAPDVAAPAAATSGPAQTGPLDPEHIEASMVSVEGLPKGEISTAELTRQLGRPARVAKGAVECGGVLATEKSPVGDIWYYGKTIYEVNGSRAILTGFDVTTGKYRGKIGQLVLNQNTTFEDVRRFFPKAAKAVDTPATGRPGEEMYLPFYEKNVPMDGSLNLLFKQGRLQEVLFFSPC